MSEKWEFPGGKLQAGESPEQALRREFQEELGVDIEVGQCLYEGAFLHDGERVTLLAFQVELESDTISLREHTDYAWLTPKEIASIDLADSDRPILRVVSRVSNNRSGSN